MRIEIKFRGKSQKGWHYFTIWETHLLPAIEPETVGQYTELKDMNKVEMYGGDIVEFEGKTAEIIFSHGCFWAEWKKDESALPIHSVYKPEVIGNIYENPELL